MQSAGSNADDGWSIAEPTGAGGAYFVETETGGAGTDEAETGGADFVETETGGADLLETETETGAAGNDDAGIGNDDAVTLAETLAAADRSGGAFPCTDFETPTWVPLEAQPLISPNIDTTTAITACEDERAETSKALASTDMFAPRRRPGRDGP